VAEDGLKDAAGIMMASYIGCRSTGRRRQVVSASDELADCCCDLARPSVVEGHSGT
jgi:hypothetical protein